MARRYDVSRGLLWHWRRVHRESRDRVAAVESSAFLPMTVVGEPGRPSDGPDRSIEIVLPGGVCVRVGRGVDLKMLRGVLAALRS